MLLLWVRTVFAAAYINIQVSLDEKVAIGATESIEAEEWGGGRRQGQAMCDCSELMTHRALNVEATGVHPSTVMSLGSTRLRMCA